MSRSRKLIWLGVLPLAVWTVFVWFLYRDSTVNNRVSTNEMAVVEARVTFERTARTGGGCRGWGASTCRSANWCSPIPT